MMYSTLNAGKGQPTSGIVNEQPLSSAVWKHHRKTLISWASVTFVGFFLFKLLYPFPDFFSDSYSYIFAALARLDANIWPIGYSKYLLAFHSLTHSPLALVWFQYILYSASALYFFLTLIYFYPIGRIYRKALFIFLFANPLFFYLGNYVSSDSLFASISLCWLSQLIWIIQRPRLYQIFVQAVLLFAAFTVRYNAMYYPFIAMLAYLFSNFPKWAKVVGILLGPALILPFVIHSRTAAKDLTGTAQFPILSGWQWGNNALYMREFISVDNASFPSPQTAELDRIALDYFQHTPVETRNLSDYVANFFIREPKSPLKVYLHTHYKITDPYSNVAAWGMASPIFSDYGRFLIRHYPMSYFQHFLLLNTKNYFFPPLEKLEVYNVGQDNIWRLGAEWFDMTDLKMWCVSKYLQGGLLLVFPFLFFAFNLFFLFGIIRIIITQGFQQMNKGFAGLLVLLIILLTLNFGFSVFANIIVIRYQIFPMILFLSADLILLETLLSTTKKQARVTQESKITEPPTNIYATGN